MANNTYQTNRVPNKSNMVRSGTQGQLPKIKKIQNTQATKQPKKSR